MALELLDDALPMPAPYPNLPSLILPIDVATFAAKPPVALVGRNPFGTFFPYGGALWMAEPGDFASTTETLAGIERFDPETSTSSLLVRESDLGGSVAEVAITAGCGAAIIADSSAKNLTSLVTFDPRAEPSSRTRSKPVFGPATAELRPSGDALDRERARGRRPDGHWARVRGARVRSDGRVHAHGATGHGVLAAEAGRVSGGGE